jgi:hypothetical protein
MAGPAVESRDLPVVGDPALARGTVINALAGRGFAITWADEWNGTATKGSKAMQVLFGAFALRLEYGVNVFTADDGTTVVRLSRPSTGVTGGLIGRSKATTRFRELADEVTEVFRANGVLKPDHP